MVAKSEAKAAKAAAQKAAAEAEKAAQKEAEKKPVTDEGSESSDDDAVPDLEEGEISEAQRKVAEAAGLAEQVDRAGKQSRSEKKARKLFSKLGLKQVSGVSRVCIRKSKVCCYFFRYD